MQQEEAEQLSGYKFSEGWTFHPIYKSDALSGFVMEKDSEIHVWRSPEFQGRWFTRGDIERVINPLIQKYGFVTTKVMKANRIGQRFVHRLGFFKVADKGDSIVFIAEKFNHARH